MLVNTGSKPSFTYFAVGAKYAAIGLVSSVFILGAKPTGLSSSFAWQFRLAAQLRTPVLVFVVVPLSFVRWATREIRNRIRDVIRRSKGDDWAVAGHAGRVQIVVDQVKAWNKSGSKKPMRTARPKWLGMNVHIAGKEDSHRIKVHHLNHILSVSVDEENPTITCEPGVTMGDLTRRLAPAGMMLDLHVEMESITVGGAAMGFGIETNSHATGLFQETVLAYELVDSLGNVHNVTAESDPDLFRALPWSHGSIGFLTAVTVKLVRVKPYVHMQYIITNTADELTKKLRDLTEGEESPRFVEATIFTKEKAVIQIGEYADRSDVPPAVPVHYINWFWKPFFFRYLESLLHRFSTNLKPPLGVCHRELIPLKHYTHRFTRSIFWELEDMIPFSNHPIYRCLWGWLGAPEVSLLKMSQGPVIRRASVEAHVVQESIAPLNVLAECIDKFDEWFGVYPLLVFPVRIYDRGDMSGMLNPRNPDAKLPGKNYAMYVDIGAYGVPRVVKEGYMWNAKTNVRAMEHWTREKKGFQALYTDIFSTRKELRQMFDHTLLDKVRSRDDIQSVGAFAELYDRVKSDHVNLTEETEAEKKTK